MARKQEKFVATNSEKEGDNNNFLKSVIDTNYSISNQLMVPLVVEKKPHLLCLIFSKPILSYC